MRLHTKRITGWLKSSVLSVIGLTIAISATLLVAWYLFFEASFDGSHANRHRIYRVSMEINAGGTQSEYAATGALAGREIVRKYPLFEHYASFRIVEGDNPIRHRDRAYPGNRVYAANNQVFKVFSYGSVVGSLDHALAHPGSIVLTRRLAAKIFGRRECLNQVIELEGEPFTVTAVLEDIPPNSDLVFDALVHDAKTVTGEEERLQSYFDTDYYTFVLRRESGRPRDAATVLNHYSKEFNALLRQEAGTDFTVRFRGTPLPDLHLSPPLLLDTPKGNADTLYTLSLLALFLVVIGVTNFVNTNIVTAYKKATGIGLKRLFGVSNRRVQWEFIAGAGLVVGVSTGLSVLVVAGLLRYTGFAREVAFWPGLPQSLGFVGSLALLLVLLSSLGGMVPAGHMARHPVAKLLKDKVVLVSHRSWSHRIILFFQLAVSAGLVIFTLELYRQLAFFNRHPPGFDRESVLVINPGKAAGRNAALLAFKKNLLNQSAVRNVSFCQSIPGEAAGEEIFYVLKDGRKKELVYSFIRADEHYFALLGIPVVQGRSFNAVHDAHALIVTKSFMNHFPGLNPAAIRISQDTTKAIVGVVADYHQTSFHHPREPLVFRKLDPSKDEVRRILVKAEAGSLATIRREWNRLNLGVPFDYAFLGDFIDQQYERENRLLTVFVACSGVAIALSFFGLFSVLSIIIQGRRKELAVRTVLGGSLSTHFRLLAGPFLRLVPVVFLVTVPVCHVLIGQWRQHYALSADPSASPYLVALLGVVGVIALNIGYLLYRSLRANLAALIKREY
jgi:putative ABC transport system permease protein